ncbi:ribose-phosphate pyrophosphokinase [bacterium]|nr:ribose-phosphate pyrophosphokinase [bacterium]
MASSHGKLRIFGGRGHPGITDSICTALSSPPGKIQLFTFKNDNLFVRIGENVRGRDVFFVQTCAPPVNERFMETLIAVDAFRRASAGRITVVLPYYPYARTDKKDQPRVPITARLVADLLLAAGVDRILTMDLHSEQIQGFFGVPSDQLLAAPVLAHHFLKQGLQGDGVVVVSPDTGNARRVRGFARRLDAGFAIIDKRRLGNDDKSEVLNVVGEVDGKTAILLDDEIDTGGTMIHAAEAILARGAKEVQVAATHGVFSADAPQRLQDSRLSSVVVTDTFPRPPSGFEKLRVLSVADLFANAIRAIHEDLSITEIFR